MEKAFRIKRTSWISEIGIPVLILAVLFGAAGAVLGEVSLRFILACAFLAASALHGLFWLRMKNANHLMPLGFYLFAAVTFLTIPLGNDYFTAASAAAAGILFVLFMRVLYKRKIKWRAREVLELAARSVRSAEDGFTERPFPAGKIPARPEEWEGFVGFLLKHGIAYPLADGQKLVLVVPEKMLLFLLGLKKDYRSATHVAVGQNSQLTVKISGRDYRRYQQDFTFDKLCAALGHLFVDFLEIYRKGEGSEIIERMDTLKFVA